MTLRRLHVLAAFDSRGLERLLGRLTLEPQRGRPWSCTLRRRVLITCAALRTNLTFRELAAVADISKSTVHRIVARLTSSMAR